MKLAWKLQRKYLIICQEWLELHHEEYLSRALEIAAKHKMAIYDALFIALSTDTNIPLLTLDERQEKTLKEYGISVTLI
ncbi:MAG: type II toxin-antitoxin system VapC family toxin [Candidatus Bathycorpusculaceae bacterium]